MAEFENKIINGKEVAERIRNKVKNEVAELSQKYGAVPCLVVIIVGENPASKVYVRNKKNACEQVGIESIEYALPEETTQEELEALIYKLNRDDKVNGILVQMPLPKHLSEKRIIDKISPDKDVDCFHPVNVGRLVAGNPTFLPCTPSGVIELIKATGIEIAGKNCVVCGRSNIVGKPMAHLLMAENGTVTVVHSKTENPIEIMKNADIVVAAIGSAKFYDAKYFKEGAVVIDVGMNRDENGKLCGDVDFDSVYPICSAITPVPGGVGPMTVTMLLENTLTSFEKMKSEK